PILRATFPASEEHTPRSLARTHARPGSTPRKARRSHADGRAAALTRRHDAEAEHEAGSGVSHEVEDDPSPAIVTVARVEPPPDDRRARTPDRRRVSARVGDRQRARENV